MVMTINLDSYSRSVTCELWANQMYQTAIIPVMENAPTIWKTKDNTEFGSPRLCFSYKLRRMSRYNRNRLKRHFTTKIRKMPAFITILVQYCSITSPLLGVVWVDQQSTNILFWNNSLSFEQYSSDNCFPLSFGSRSLSCPPSFLVAHDIAADTVVVDKTIKVYRRVVLIIILVLLLLCAQRPEARSSWTCRTTPNTWSSRTARTQRRMATICETVVVTADRWAAHASERRAPTTNFAAHVDDDHVHQDDVLSQIAQPGVI